MTATQTGPETPTASASLPSFCSQCDSSTLTRTLPPGRKRNKYVMTTISQRLVFLDLIESQGFKIRTVSSRDDD